VSVTNGFGKVFVAAVRSFADQKIDSLKKPRQTGYRPGIGYIPDGEPWSRSPEHLVRRHMTALPRDWIAGLQPTP